MNFIVTQTNVYKNSKKRKEKTMFFIKQKKDLKAELKKAIFRAEEAKGQLAFYKEKEKELVRQWNNLFGYGGVPRGMQGENGEAEL